jgi:hypothetical protein
MSFHMKDNLLCVGNVLKTVQISMFIANSIAFFRKKSNKIKENFFFLFIIDKNHFRMYNGFINNDAAVFDVLWDEPKGISAVFPNLGEGGNDYEVEKNLIAGDGFCADCFVSRLWFRESGTTGRCRTGRECVNCSSRR